MKDKFQNIISEIKKSTNDKIDFCNKLISLDVDDGFDVFMANNQDAADLFDLAIRYLDNETTNRDEVWNQIESFIYKLGHKE